MLVVITPFCDGMTEVLLVEISDLTLEPFSSMSSYGFASKILAGAEARTGFTASGSMSSLVAGEEYSPALLC